MQEKISELEGAILSEIEHRGQKTAFQVRRAFQLSPSIEWSGSAGAVYPAVKRLTKAGLLEAVPQKDKRATKHLFLTPAGHNALESWSRDCTRAISVGIDPFRLRSGIWMAGGDFRDGAFVEELRHALNEKLQAELQSQKGEDPVEAIRIELNVRLIRMRLEWLDEAVATLAG